MDSLIVNGEISNIVSREERVNDISTRHMHSVRVSVVRKRVWRETCISVSLVRTNDSAFLKETLGPLLSNMILLSNIPGKGILEGWSSREHCWEVESERRWLSFVYRSEGNSIKVAIGEQGFGNRRVNEPREIRFLSVCYILHEFRFIPYFDWPFSQREEAE